MVKKRTKKPRGTLDFKVCKQKSILAFIFLLSFLEENWMLGTTNTANNTAYKLSQRNRTYNNHSLPERKLEPDYVLPLGCDQTVPKNVVFTDKLCGILDFTHIKNFYESSKNYFSMGVHAQK